MIFRIQNDLFDLGADLCVPENKSLEYEPLRIVQMQVDRLENEIDEMNSNLSELKSFILPGGSMESAYLHLARTCLLYTSPSPRDRTRSRMPSSA